ncbi:MAG: hypothetical protein V3U18_09920 [Alphaproteobacteria bacterium]
MKFLTWLLDRLSEPSTWAGFGIAGVAGIALSPETWELLFAWFAMGAGLASAILKEKIR